MKHIYRWLKSVCLVLLLSTGFSAWGQGGSCKAIVEEYARKQHFSGVVLVARGGKAVYHQAVGAGKREPGRSLRLNDRFRLCSVTKTFTAALILQLAEEGRLHLDAPIETYLPGYTGAGRSSVTIEHLLTYSSGIPDQEPYGAESMYRSPVPLDSFIARWCSGAPDTAPGTRYRYNNGDYILLGKIIENITGQSYETALRQRILKPLRMRNTGMLHSAALPRGLVTPAFYNDSLNTFGDDPLYCIDNYFAAGAMYSTATDLLKFDQGIFSHKILKQATVARMVSPHPKLDNVAFGFWAASGYGAIPTPFVYRPGGIYGATANWIHIPAGNTSIIVLSNTNATNLFQMSQALYAALAK